MMTYDVVMMMLNYWCE